MFLQMPPAELNYRKSSMFKNIRLMTPILGLILSIAGSAAFATDGDTAIAVGASVSLTGPDVTLRSGNRAIPVGREFVKYQVRRLANDWLYLVSDRATGWVRKDQVVPVERSEGYLTAILDRDPNLTWARLWRAAVLLDRKDLPKAQADLSSILAREPTDVSALALRGRVLTVKGDFDAAIADLDKAIALAPSNPRAYLYRAAARQAKKQLEKADEDFAEALRLDPNDVEAYLMRGIVRRDQDRLDDAIADSNAAVQLAPRNARAFLERAIARKEKGQLDWALADLNEAVNLDPESAQAFLNLSIVRFLLRDFAGAYDSAETALKLAPSDKETLNHTAWLLATVPEARFRDGRRAVEYARQADQIAEGKDPDVLDTLSAALAEDGKFDEALAMMTRALELYPKENPERPEAEKRLELFKSRKAFRSDP